MEHGAVQPSPWMIIPFALLLGMIAMGPLLFPKWWEKHYGKVALSLGAITALYYIVFLGEAGRVKHIAHDYVSFIAVIGSLFVVAGGIHITVKGEATPLANTFFLFCGALASNVLGTTGASMLLVRPWMRMNKYRLTTHHIIFFIFLVSNVGGCLTPIGDPPLFIGYLYGVPFWWVARHCWGIWLTLLVLLLGAFWFLDYRNYLRAPAGVREKLAEPPETWRLEGKRNILLLAVVVLSVFIEKPAFLREGVMLAAAAASWKLTPRRIHDANHFNFHPLTEVALLFIGIFATMLPALDWLEVHAHEFVRTTPAFFYWCTGILSSVLDNAPTYLSFLTAAFGLFTNDELIKQIAALAANGGAGLQTHTEAVRQTYEALRHFHPDALAAGHVTREQIQIAALLGSPALSQFVQAISVGAVFFGAATYIGNGPNFMVKAIAAQKHVQMPSFFGYIARYTLPILLPALIAIWFLFFRG